MVLAGTEHRTLAAIGGEGGEGTVGEWPDNGAGTFLTDEHLYP